MDVQNEQISPEIIQAIITQANAKGLTVNDYLAQLLGISDRQEDLALSGHVEASPKPRNEAMLSALAATSELLKDMPVRGSTEETLKMLREGRDGGMWGYEPNS